MRELEGELRFLHNFGFEKKASMLAAGFIHNRELTFSQSVLALSLILPLGGVNMLLLMNFLKYFKEMSSGEQASSVKIEHLLSLLAIKFHKRNEIIL
uniref:Predicted protein n=1 Tax=Hordeum vulgare subsp. vulgare TaxID=112509 RepID=F2DUV2_HORVV|nr:predicted protein [Hordeum vulgare subsp. vulgare]